MEKRPVPLLLLTLTLLGAQQRPPANTEVYLTGLQVDRHPLTGGDKTSLINISNNPGYDNEPSFTPDGKSVLFVSNRDGKQTDIYRYDIATKVLTQLTHTAESEYSPLVTPDGRTFSVIRVESDGTQRLWRFDLDGTHPRLVLENVKGVGYQAWLDATHVAVFIVGTNGQPNTLQLADTTTGTTEMIDSNPGHGLALRPHGRSAAPTLTYVCKTDPTHWVVKEFDLATKKVTVIADALPGAVTDLAGARAGNEDLAWDPSRGGLFMATGSKVFELNKQGGWSEEGDFTAAGIAHITRLAIGSGPNPRLVFVAEPVSK